MKKSGLLFISLFTAAIILSGCNEKENKDKSSAVTEVSDSTTITSTTEAVSSSAISTTFLSESKTTTSAEKSTTDKQVNTSKTKVITEKTEEKISAVKSSTGKSVKTKSTASKTTVKKTKALSKKSKTSKPQKTTVKTKKTTVKQKGISKSDIEQVNSYIKEIAQLYGIGTECSACNKQGVIYLSGNVDLWGDYAWNTPIETSKLKSTGRINEAVCSHINAIYNEWLNDGKMSKNDIKKYGCIYVYWNKTDGSNYDLYLMW